MANEKEFKVIISVEDGQAKVKIEGLTNALNKNSAASKGAASSTDEFGNANKRLKQPLDGTIGSFERLIRQQELYIKNVARVPADVAKAQKRILEYRAEINRLNQTLGVNSKVNGDMISNAGLAGATLTELGRTISDSNYGLRGMANNLAQLSTLFITLIAKTNGGFIPAMRMLGKQLFGPLGIILAFQTLIAVFEKLAIEEEKAKDNANELSKQYKDLAREVDVYMSKINDLNTTESERAILLDQVASKSSELKDIVIANKDDLAKLTAEIDKYIRIQTLRAELDETITKYGENQEKHMRNVKALREDDYEFMRKAISDRAFWPSWVQKVTDDLTLSDEAVRRTFKNMADETYESGEDFTNNINSILKKLDEYGDSAVLALQGDSDKIQDLILDLRNKIDLSDKDGFDRRIKQVGIEYNELVKKIKDVIPEGEKRDESLLLALKLRTSKEKKIIEDFYEYLKKKQQEAADLNEKALVKRDKETQEYYKNNAKTIDDTYEQELAAEISMGVKSAKTRKEANKIKRDISVRALNDLKDNYKQALEAGEITAEQYAAKIADIEGKMTGLFISGLTGGEEKDLTKQEKIEEAIKLAQESIQFLENTFNAQFDAEISREEAKTEKMNNELRKRLKNEQLSAKERENINLLIAANEDKLQQKRDEIAEKNFKLQKAISIGQALINTYEMASRAFNAVLAGPEKFLGISALSLAKVAAGITTAFGLAQVNAIRKQQFVPSALGSTSVSSSGGASAPAIQAPDFNIVGQSGVNQLRDLIQAQSERPVKAYVVSKDISTAQELDRNKVQSAGL